MGLDPRTLRSRPEPKADAQPLSHPGAPGLGTPEDFFVPGNHESLLGVWKVRGVFPKTIAADEKDYELKTT